MQGIPADEDGEGDREVALEESQLYDLFEDAPESFNPFDDVFKYQNSIHPPAQGLSGQNFHDSRPEDAWTENESGRRLFQYLESTDNSWWDANMPDSVAAQRGGMSAMLGGEDATAMPSPESHSQAWASLVPMSETVDKRDLPFDEIEVKAAGRMNATKQSRFSSGFERDIPAQSTPMSHEHIPFTEERPRRCGSEAQAVSRFARTGIGEDTSNCSPGRMRIHERAAGESSCAIIAPKRRRESHGPEREQRNKKPRQSVASIPNTSHEDIIHVQDQPLNSQYPYQSTEQAHHQETKDNCFPLVQRHRRYSSDCENEEERRSLSAYPDPTLYALAPARGSVKQPRAVSQPLQASKYPAINSAGLSHKTPEPSGIGSTKSERRLTDRSQFQVIAGIDIDGQKRKIDWPGQRLPDLTNLSKWPPPYPVMDRPGPGGPGTWPCDWVQLDSDRTKVKYKDFLPGTSRIPGRHPWQVYCYWFPNHIRDAALDHFRAAGWNGRKVWDHYHHSAVEDCRVDPMRNPAERPWNYLQAWFSRRNKEVMKGAADTRNAPEPTLQSQETTQQIHTQLVHRRPIHLQSHPRPTRPVTQETRPALRQRRESKTKVAQPWWQGQLMMQVDRVRKLLQLTNPVSNQQSNRTQIMEADLHLRRQFPVFAQSVWLQALDGRVVPRNDMHPMLALRNMYDQLRQADPLIPLPDRQEFCDTMLMRYLQHINSSLDREEQRLLPSANSLTSRNVEAFKYPQENLYGFHPTKTAGDWLLQQPKPFHGIAQSQHSNIGTFIEGGQLYASSILRVGEPRTLNRNIPPFAFNQLGESWRASPPPAPSASLVDARERSPGQQAVSRKGLPPGILEYHLNDL